MANKKKMQNSSSKVVFWTIGIIAAFVLGFIFLGNHATEKDSTSKSKPKTKEAIDYSNQPYLGDETAPVSIIEFGDYKCPNCKNFAENIVPIIEQEFVETGKAKFYFMNDSFINVDSIRTAKFAESVFQELGNDMFWKFHDLIYKNQPEDPEAEKKDVFTEEFLTNTLKELANTEEVNKVVENFRAKKSDEAWDKDMKYAEMLGVTGTPTLFINGKMFTGQSMDDLKAMIEQAAKGE